MRRKPVARAVMVGATLGLAAWSATSPALADGINTTSYVLTNGSTSPVDAIVLDVKPDAALNLNGAPITILPGSTQYTSNGPPLETQSGAPVTPGAGDGVLLDFIGANPSNPSVSDPGVNHDAFAKDGVLKFTLNLNQNFAGTPDVSLFQPSPGVSLQVITPTPSTTPSTPSQDPTPPPVTNTPEPVSLALWSALAGAGAWRARRRRS